MQKWLNNFSWGTEFQCGRSRKPPIWHERKTLVIGFSNKKGLCIYLIFRVLASGDSSLVVSEWNGELMSAFSISEIRTVQMPSYSFTGLSRTVVKYNLKRISVFGKLAKSHLFHNTFCIHGLLVSSTLIWPHISDELGAFRISSNDAGKILSGSPLHVFSVTTACPPLHNLH